MSENSLKKSFVKALDKLILQQTAQIEKLKARYSTVAKIEQVKPAVQVNEAPLPAQQPVI